jgi:hypothetical protein
MTWAFCLPSGGRAAKLLTGPQRPFQPCRRFPRGLRGHVCVDVESDADLRVTEDLHHHTVGYALGEKDAGRRVPQVVKTNLP